MNKNQDSSIQNSLNEQKHDIFTWEASYVDRKLVIKNTESYEKSNSMFEENSDSKGFHNHTPTVSISQQNNNTDYHDYTM